MKPRLIILAHPRSGTGYAAWLCQQYGLDVGHERLKSDGISSWMWVTKDENPPYGHGYKPAPKGYEDFPIYLVRNPDDVILSTHYTEGATEAYREEKTDAGGGTFGGLIGASISFARWHIESEENWGKIPVIKLHHLPQFLETFTGKRLNPIPVRKVNDRSHPTDKSVLAETGVMRDICWNIFNNAMDPREAALLRHYKQNPKHHTWATLGNLEKAFYLAGVDPCGAYVLDAGCGRGAAGPELKKMGVDHVDGFDYSQDRVNEADKTGAYSLLWTGNIYDTSMGKYHAILCLEVLEHLAEPNKALNRLRGHGPVIGSVPLNHPYKAHLNVYTSQQDVESKLGVKALWSDKDRTWFLANKL